LHPGYRWPWLYRGIRVEGWTPSSVVTWAQTCLSQLLGIGLPQDGIIGPDTQQAIASFQAQQRLPSTSILDDNTIGALQAACSVQQESVFGGPREYQEFVDEEFEEHDLGTSRSGRAGRMVDPAKVDCQRLDRSLPIFRAIGTTDPVGVLEAVCQRAVAMLDNTIAELTRIRGRVRAGEPPAFPLISDTLGWSLQTRMLMRASDAAAWTGRGPRTAEQILRWLINIRKTIAGGELRYTCLATGCGPRVVAFTFPGHLGIHLCRLFWHVRTGLDAATNRDFQAQTIIHEVSHIFYDTEDSGRGPGDAYCIAQFVAEANGTPVLPEISGNCGPPMPSRQHELEEENFAGAPEIHKGEEPYQWPTSRSFNPPAPQIIPAGPFQTALCQSILSDWDDLSFAVGELKAQVRQRPSNRALVTNRSDIVRSLSRKMVARLQNGTYIQQGCSQHDLALLADSVNALRGPGGDADTGSWPVASNAGNREARRAARESLRHLLNWTRRAARMYPGI
jgi:hypothetical protein